MLNLPLMKLINSATLVLLIFAAGLSSAQAASITLLAGKLTLELPRGSQRVETQLTETSRNITIAAYQSREAGLLARVLLGKHKTDAERLRQGSKAQVAEFVAGEIKRV
jgi:hypothetical protein